MQSMKHMSFLKNPHLYKSSEISYEEHLTKLELGQYWPSLTFNNIRCLTRFTGESDRPFQNKRVSRTSFVENGSKIVGYINKS